MSRKNKDNRVSIYRSCAESLDWEYKPYEDMGMIKWLLDFKLFKAGGKKTMSPLIMSRNVDLQYTCAFDYSYVVSTGKSSYTFKQTVYFRYSKALALPHFIMVPERWYHRLGTYFGMQDIDFLEYPVFSHNYLLQGADEDYIRHHFNHPEMIRFFDKQKFYSLEGVNYLMILYVHNKILPHKQVMQLINIGNALHDFLSDKTPDIALPEFDEIG